MTPSPEAVTWIQSLPIGSWLETVFRPVLFGHRSFVSCAQEAIEELETQLNAAAERELEKDTIVGELTAEIDKLNRTLADLRGVVTAAMLPTKPALTEAPQPFKKHQWVADPMDPSGWLCSVCRCTDLQEQAHAPCGVIVIFRGTKCGQCHEPQFGAPHGVTCINGHNGASPEPCDHPNVHVEFDAAAAQYLSSPEVRKRWPRFWGPCPDCHTQLIKYASTEHYVAGDW